MRTRAATEGRPYNHVPSGPHHGCSLPMVVPNSSLLYPSSSVDDRFVHEPFRHNIRVTEERAHEEDVWQDESICREPSNPMATASPHFDKSHTNIVLPSTCFVGRGDELDWVADRVGTGNRLLTICGPPGCGKSRLTIEFAKRYLSQPNAPHPHHAWFFDLSTCQTLDDVVNCVGETIGLPTSDDQADGTTSDRVGLILAGQGNCLFILDNFEQVARPARSVLVQWLNQAPSGIFVSTSRELLGLPGERVLQLTPLPVEKRAQKDLAEQVDAVALFVDRARAVRPSFELTPDNEPVVEQIVRRLDGLPLAIELAAARMAILNPESLLKRLAQQFDLLTRPHRDAVSHHQTLIGAIEWSWNLLDQHEQLAMTQCAVFRVSFNVDAAESVIQVRNGTSSPAIIDLLQSLVEKSLLTTSGGADLSGLRFSMLQSIADFAAKRLPECLDTADPRTRHALHYAEQAWQWLEKIRLWDDQDSVKRLFVERHNLLSAHEHCIDQLSDEGSSGEFRTTLVEAALKIVLGLGQCFYSNDAHFARQLDKLNTALELSRTVENVSDHLIIEAELEMSLALRVLGRFDEGRALLDAVVEKARSGEDATLIAKTIGMKSAFLRNQGKVDEAIRVFEEANPFFERSTDPVLEAQFKAYQASLFLLKGEPEAAKEATEVALGIFRQRKMGKSIRTTLVRLGQIYAKLGRIDDARTALLEALEIHRIYDDWYLQGFTLFAIGELAQAEGRLETAERCFSKALSLRRKLGRPGDERQTLIALGKLSLLMGNNTAASEHFVAVLRSLAGYSDESMKAEVLGHLGITEWIGGDLNKAEQLFTEAIEHTKQPDQNTVLRAKMAALLANGAKLEKSQALLNKIEISDSIVESKPELNIYQQCVHLEETNQQKSANKRNEGLESVLQYWVHFCSIGRAEPQTPWGIGMGAKLEFESQVAARILFNALPTSAQQSARARVLGRAISSFVCSKNGDWFQLPNGVTKDISRRKRLTGLLRCLTSWRIREPGVMVSGLTVLEEGWPDEKVSVDSGLARVYTSMADLRKLGLGNVLVSDRDGYCLNPDIPLVCVKHT